MKITDKSFRALAKLNSWDRKLEYYSFYGLHDIELYDSFEKVDCELDMWLKPDVFADKSIDFKQFAYARDGSAFALWLDDSIEGEPPVVYFDSDYGLFLLAISMENFLCKIAHGRTLAPSSEDSWAEIYEWQYEDLADESEEGKSAEEIKELVGKEITKFSASVDKSYTCSDDEVLRVSLKSKLTVMSLYGEEK